MRIPPFTLAVLCLLVLVTGASPAVAEAPETPAKPTVPPVPDCTTDDEKPGCPHQGDPDEGTCSPDGCKKPERPTGGPLDTGGIDALVVRADGEVPVKPDNDPAPATDNPEEKPKPEGKPWAERVAVTAEIAGDTSAPLGTTATLIDPQLSMARPTTLTDLVTAVPGVSDNGQGGLFQVFSIRGVSRQRVLSLVSGMRIVSERRAGSTATFIDPTLMGSVEVLQGPSTTQYGSGALGGVVGTAPVTFSGWSFDTGYDTNGSENYQTVGVGGEGWSIGIARRDARNGEAADGTELNSHFTQLSAVARYQWGGGPRTYELLFIPSAGDDIGKASSDFPTRTTNYPEERHQMFRFSVDSTNGWRTHAYVHHHELQTEVTEGTDRNVVDNQSLDYGVRWEQDDQLGQAELQWGVEAIGRSDVRATDSFQDLSGTAPPTEMVSLDDADELEAGAFGSLRWNWTRTQLEAGGRYSWQAQSNAARSTDDSQFNGHLAVTHRLWKQLEIGGTLASGVRFANLGERFFRGTTGRGDVVGNPSLDTERALSLDASLRWTGRRHLVKGVVFRNDIDDYIERVEVSPGLLTFVNLTSGVIDGVELHGVWLPADRWNVSYGGQWIEGRANDGSPLADVPANELFAGITQRTGDWSFDARWAHRFAKDDPGSGEVATSSAEILSAGATWHLSEAWGVTLAGSNLLDEEYPRSADSQAPGAAGRAWSLRLRWRE